jgi:dynein heavy chain
VKEIATAVDNGKAVLIEDCEELIDPVIDPILQKQQVKTDAGLVQIKIGDKTYNFDDNFTLYMTTKLPNPHYIPEICIKVTLINFTVTFSGLQQQLLGDVVIAERPEVEKQRDMIVLQMASDSKSLKDQENLILKNLLGATIFEILDSDELINLLKVSKETTDAINIRMEEAKEVEITIDSTRNDYKEVAIRGSIIYFVIADLSGIDPMY